MIMFVQIKANSNQAAIKRSKMCDVFKDFCLMYYITVEHSGMINIENQKKNILIVILISTMSLSSASNYKHASTLI